MAFSHGTAGRMWLDGFASACYLNEFSMEIETDDAETTTLCQTQAKTFIPGLEEGTVEFEGFFDNNSVSPTTTFEFFLNARRRTTFPVVYNPQGGLLIGDPSYLMNGFLTSHQVETTVDEAAAIEAEFLTSNTAHRGIVLLPEAARTSTANGTSFDQTTVTTTAGAAAVLSVSSVSGTTPTLDVKVQHSVDNSVWADLITFSQQNSVNGEFQEVSGTINRYVRAIWTIGGGSPSFTFNVAFKRK